MRKCTKSADLVVKVRPHPGTGQSVRLSGGVSESPSGDIGEARESGGGL